MISLKIKKLNVVDYCIIAFLVLVIAFVGVRVLVFSNLGSAMSVSSGQKECELVFVGENVLSDFAENIQTSGELYTQDDELVGNVKMVKLSDGYTMIKKVDGSYVKALSPERRTVSVTVESRGKQADDGFRIYGNREVAVGRDYFIKSNDTVYQMRLTEINIK